MMPANVFRKSIGFLFLLALGLTGCAVTGHEIRQEIQDDSRGIRENMEQNEKSYENNEYLGLSSKNSDDWNSTDWSLWMEMQGGGR